MHMQLHFYMPTHIYVSFLIIRHTYCHVGCGNLLNWACDCACTVYMCVCMHVCVHVCAVCVYVQVCVYVCVCLYTCVHLFFDQCVFTVCVYLMCACNENVMCRSIGSK